MFMNFTAEWYLKHVIQSSVGTHISTWLRQDISQGQVQPEILSKALSLIKRASKMAQQIEVLASKLGDLPSVCMMEREN